MSLSQSELNWIYQQQEPDARPVSQGGMPRTKGGTHLWDELKRIQDETDKWREIEHRKTEGNTKRNLK